VSSKAKQWALVPLTVLTLVMAGCADSNSDKSATGQSDTHCVKTSGNPIVVADSSQLTGIPGFDPSALPKGEKAAADYVNCHGGIDGRPIDVASCDTRYDPAGSKACAAEAVAKGAIAVTGLDDLSSSSGADAQYAQNRIVTLNAPNQIPLVDDTNVFAVANGGTGEFYGLGHYFGAVLKPKSVRLLMPDQPYGHTYSDWIKAAAAAAGLTNIDTIYYNINITDFSSVVAKLVQDRPAVVFTLVNGSQIPLVWGQLEQQGIKASQVYIHSAAMDSRVLAKAKDVATGGNIISEFANPDDLSDPDVRIYRDAMKAAGDDDIARTALAVAGFSEVMFLEAVAKTVSKSTGPARVNAQSVKAYLSKTLGAGSGQTIPVFLGTPMGAAARGFSGIHRGAVQILSWDGSKFVTSVPFFTAPELVSAA
jgi:ABC-type branched-subunit amino acid transport system substrate-binding protein